MGKCATNEQRVPKDEEEMANKLMKYLPSLFIRKTQMKIILKVYLSSGKTAALKNE